MKTMFIFLKSIVCQFFFIRESHAFEGDYQIADPTSIRPIESVSLLNGDFDDDYDDYEDDPLGDVFGDITRLSASTDPNDFISGDIDAERQNSMFQPSDFAEGGFFQKVFKKKSKSAAAKGKSASTKSINTLAKNVLNKEKGKFGFPQDLVKSKMLSNVIREDKPVDEISNNISTLKTLSNSPGALTAKFDFARLVVTGGEIRITQTNLKIPGQNLATAINIWQLNYPGLSRSSVQIAPSSGILTFLFEGPTPPEITTAFAIFIMLTAPVLKSIKGAEIGLSITGTLTNGTTLSYTKDRVAIFTTNEDKTLICYLPTVEIKQSLYAVPFASPTTPLPITVSMTGLPEGSNAVVRLAGVDSSEFADYKKMIGVDV